MACCASDDETKEAARRSRLIDRQLAQEKRNLRQEIKILLLGAGESGKTTFLKQMRIIHGEDYSEQDRLEFRSSIYHNILKGMKILVEARRRLQIPLSNPQCDEYSQVITNYHRTGEITPEDFQEYTGALGTLWKDAGIRETEKRKNEFQLGDNMAYLLNNLDRIGQVGYIPNKEDVLYARKATRGVYEYLINIKGVPFRFVDVGGQRSQRQNLPLLLPPYLNSMHNSPVKLVDVYTDVTKEIWQTVCQLGKIQQDVLYRASSKVWPIDGGSLMFPAKENHTLLLSGHENGSVKFWDITDVSTKLIYSLECAHFFKTADSELGQSEDQQASQFRQVGFWDPRYDDDQLVVTALSLLEDELLVGFHGGIVLHLRLSTQSAHFTIPVVRASILREDPRQLGRNFQNPLEVRADEIESPPGFHPVLCVHLFPAASITAVALAKEQQLIGVGCIYGFTIIDHLLRTPLITTSTYDEVQNEIALTRMQSIRRSFRHSLKRLNVSRSMRNSQSTQRSMRSSSFVRAGSIRVSNRVTAKAPLAAAEPLPPPQPEPTPASAEVTPVALRRDSIRTISFMAPCHLGGNTPMPCVIVGTNQGSALAYTIDMPLAKHRDSRNPILMSIEEELNAKKNHAVLFIGVFDGQNYLLDINDKGSYHPGKGNEYLVVCTEDAIKTVSLPGGKKKNRIKLKANDEDEYHILSAHYLRSTGQSAMLLMDSSGNISVYNLPDLRLVYKESCVDSADAIGQRHFVCGTNGVLLHQRSPSEFMRGSVTEESRLEMQFSWSDNVTALRPKQPVIPNTPKSLFERKLEDPSELTTILSDSSSEPRGPTSPISEVGSPRAFQERAL
eukprot:Em0020g952a